MAEQFDERRKNTTPDPPVTSCPFATAMATPSHISSSHTLSRRGGAFDRALRPPVSGPLPGPGTFALPSRRRATSRQPLLGGRGAFQSMNLLPFPPWAADGFSSGRPSAASIADSRASRGALSSPGGDKAGSSPLSVRRHDGSVNTMTQRSGHQGSGRSWRSPRGRAHGQL